ncbi:MAG: PadR family transcriptional regulator [Acidobacteria bacterium]|nr:PadR family transcriptional regulator [Acidobacteriota bacterium]
MVNRVTYLGELEQMILWAVIRLDEDAYGMAIRDELERRTGRAASRGGVYVTLDRLVSKGYLSSRLGDGDERRAGRRRRYFLLTEPGRVALREARSALVNLWHGIESVVEES